MIRAFVRGRFVSSAILLILLAFPAFTMRSLLLAERGWLSAADLSGFGGDLLTSASVAAVLILIGVRFRFLAIPAAVLLALLAVGNYEHIRILGSNLNPTYVTYLSDGTFIAGSGSSLTHPVISFALLALSAAGALVWTSSRFQRERSLAPALGTIALVAVVLAVNANDDQATSWRRENVVVASLGSLWAQTAGRTAGQASGSSEMLRADLDGTPIVEYPVNRPNVLFVVLESVSGAYLPSFRDAAGMRGGDEISMPLLDKLAGEGLAYPLFLANQRQTNRGTFALLCGRLPKLSSSTAKMTEYAEITTAPKCLPEMLREEGYDTSYLQSAQTEFMRKDLFMNLAGFDTVLGDAWRDVEARSRGGWGVDDKTFFDVAAEHVAELEDTGSPWFLTVLTSGTHHPYTVPDDYLPGVERDIASYEYLDEAVDTFIRGLEEQGLLKDTLVVITSDESAGLKGADDGFDVLLSQNWSFAVALLPESARPKRRVEEPFSQADLALSVADYLNVPTQNWPFIGRSMFRTYGSSRPIFVANTYAQRQMALFSDSLLICNESHWDCRAYGLGLDHHFMSATTGGRPDSANVSLLKTIALVTEVPPTRELKPVRLAKATDKILVSSSGAEVIFAAPKIVVPAHHIIEVEFEAELVRGGMVQLEHNFEIRGDDPFKHGDPIPVLANGDRVRVSYSLDIRDERRVDALRLTARKIAGDADVELKIHDAHYTIVPSPKPIWAQWDETDVSVELVENSLEYMPVSRSITIDLADGGAFRWPECVLPAGVGVVADNCAARHIVFGPYFTAPAGSDIELTFEVEVLRGRASLAADMASSFGENLMAKGEKTQLEQGETWTGTLSTAVPESVSNIEARLFLEPDAAGSKIAIHNLYLRIDTADRGAGG